MAECHRVGFQCVMEARHRLDTRRHHYSSGSAYTRTSAVCPISIHVPIRAARTSLFWVASSVTLSYAVRRAGADHRTAFRLLGELAASDRVGADAYANLQLGRHFAKECRERLVKRQKLLTVTSLLLTIGPGKRAKLPAPRATFGQQQYARRQSTPATRTHWATRAVCVPSRHRTSWKF